MRYLEMAYASAALCFVPANAALSILAVLAWRAMRSSSHEARTLFLLRMLPTAGSIGVVIGVVLPAFWLFEPEATSERVGPVLCAFVALASVLVVSGLYRAVAQWIQTRRLERLWAATAVAGREAGMNAPAYRVPSPMPFAALVGVVRPRLFLSGRFIDSLSAGERRAVVDHEAGHLRALDNLKRLAMKLAPDWLALAPVGAEIEKAWTIAAEEDADDYAAGGDPARACDLAGALLKAVRFPALSCAGASGFCDHGTIAHRVERLLGDRPRRSRARTPVGLQLVSIAAVLVVMALLAAPVAHAAYATTEAAIRLLQ